MICSLIRIARNSGRNSTRLSDGSQQSGFHHGYSKLALYSSRRFLIITKLRNPPVVESGFKLRKANASFLTVDVFWYLTCFIQACLLSSLSLSKRSHEDQGGSRKEEEEVNISTPVIQLQGQRSIDRSPDFGTGTRDRL